MIQAVVIALVVLLSPYIADAACSGSGLTWTCTAGSTQANVNSAIASGTDGMTITLEAGAYTWTASTVSFDNAKGTTLACASVGACTITQATNTMLELTFSGTNTKLYRITGMAFTQSGGVACGTCIWIYPASAGSTATLSQFRIDHNSWSGYTETSALLFFGANDRAGYFYGVIDHNTITATNDNFLIKVLGHNYTVGGTNWIALTSIPSTQVKGTANNIFLEDNTFNITNGFSATGCMDTHQQAAVVSRYNTMTNCRGLDTHGIPHGGLNNWEAYRNSFTKTTGLGDAYDNCRRCFLNQGAGQWYVWDNTFTPIGATVDSFAITLLHERANADAPGIYGICDGTKSVDGNTTPQATYRGYPCVNQPGRMEVGGTPSWGKLSPNISFLNRNTKNGAKVDMVAGASGGPPDYTTEQVVEGRDYYNAVSATAQTSATSPFDGTTGIGHGTLANRPTTCTHTTSPDGDEGGGVMYWATDQGSWNVSGDGRGSGVLYRCSATNTWTVHYTPYTYPHPLQGVVAGSGAGVRGSKGLGLF